MTDWSKLKERFYNLLDTPFNYPQKLKLQCLDEFYPELIACGDKNDQILEAIRILKNELVEMRCRYETSDRDFRKYNWIVKRLLEAFGDE